ncbi:hypothetical protein [Sphingomonas sp. LaA6.9]|uniref:hypothetical protein n=1 Tax=Sphingomonas sp. LaA6.9 TaxID=2919914 RepID=UPI001F4F54A0|nr:hypothetical protein [Sphingomonas sp. LaA6.9]MCJ8158962.1 hypothetical protein [Sphingomonas sp. LaA6.9]
MRNIQPVEHTRTIEPGLMGYRIMYRREEANHCPGCGNSNWHVGRLSAQCAFCDTSLPFADGGTISMASPLHI